MLPILEAASGKRDGVDFDLCFMPEFLREGSAVSDYFNPPKTVIGADRPAAADRVAELYKGIEAPVIKTSIRTAEMAKYVDNVFHALKIAFANEVGTLSKTST